MCGGGIPPQFLSVGGGYITTPRVPTTGKNHPGEKFLLTLRALLLAVHEGL